MCVCVCVCVCVYARVCHKYHKQGSNSPSLLSWQGHSALLDHALSAFSAAAGSRGGPEHDRPEGVCTRDSPEIPREAMASISSMQS